MENGGFEELQRKGWRKACMMEHCVGSGGAGYIMTRSGWGWGNRDRECLRTTDIYSTILAAA